MAQFNVMGQDRIITPDYAPSGLTLPCQTSAHPIPGLAHNEPETHRLSEKFRRTPQLYCSLRMSHCWDHGTRKRYSIARMRDLSGRRCEELEQCG